MDHVLMKDIDGKTVVLKTSDLDDYALTKFQMYGMNESTILALRKEYLKRGGPLVDMTSDTVRKVFS